MAGKTRTSSKHGPTSSKKNFKQDKHDHKHSAAAASSRSAKDKGVTTTGSGANTTASAERKRPREDEPDKATVRSTLLNAPEEIDFPRGGGTGLTQVEVREAQLEGEKEAKDEEDREREKDTEVIKDKGKAKRRKLERALAGASIKEKNVVPKDAMRVEHLNYKRLIPGTKVLCQIVAVRPLELILSLPSQLLAHVPITNISSEFTSRLEAAGADSSSSDSGSDEEEDDLPALHELFHEGQWVVAAVVATNAADSKVKMGGREGDENVRQSRRVEMSLEPEKVNEGVAKGDLKRGFVLPAVVHDIEEDRGYTLSFGLPSSALTSFLPLSDASKLSPSPLHIGQVILTRLTKLHANERTCSVTVEPADVAATVTDALGSITSVLPGQLVSALVTAVLPAGLNVKFHGYFDGTLDAFHLPPLAAGQTFENQYKVGAKIKARVIWDSIAASPKKFALSAHPSVLALQEGSEAREKWEVGRKGRFEVRELDEEWGLVGAVFAEGEDIGAPAFVHISRITDDHLNTIPKSGPWRAGTAHAARVIGYSHVDGLVQLSLQPSVLEQKFLRVQDVKVGEEVKGTVKRLADNALFVSISGNVDGVVWPLHYADIRLKHPEKKFKPGQTVKARIFSADAERNRVALTLKKALLNTELPIVTSFAEAKVGVVTDATVTKVLDKSVLVDFFGGVRALIPAAEAAESFTSASDLARLFPLGKVLPVRIISVDAASQRIVASVRQASHPSAAVSAVNGAAASIDELDIATVASGKITALHETNLVLSLSSPAEAKGVKALLAYPTLARHRGVQVGELREALAVGQQLDDLVVVSKNADKGFVIVGLVPSKSAASLAKSASGGERLTFDGLEVGKAYAGKVAQRLPSGVVLVQLGTDRSSKLRGRVALTELGDDYAAVSSSPLEVGTQVTAVVVGKDDEQRRLDLSLRASRLRAAKGEGEGEGEVKDRQVETLDEVKVGEKVRGFVKNVANAGVFVELGREVTGRVLIKELFDEYVKDWKPRFKVGQVVEAKVISVNKLTSQLELSLRSGAVVAKKDGPNNLPGVGEAALEKGQVVRGVVKRVQDYGVFVRIEGTSVSGLCHKSKVTDDETGSWKEKVREGDNVQAVVLDVNLETKKVSLGLKKSLFPEGALSDAEDEDESDEEGEDAEMGVEGEDEYEDEDDAEGEDVDLEALLKQAAAQGSDDEEDSEEEEDVEMADETPVASTSKLPAASPSSAPLAVSTGFNWDGDEQEEAKQADDDESSSDEDEALKASTSAAKPVKKGLSTLDDRTGDLDSQAPTSVADFERLLLGSPNSSYLWIQYLAFFVGLSQLDKARELAQRALRSIHFREEGEKLNVWVALLNLENAYGDEESLEKVFREAAQANDAETVYLKLVDIYERSGKIEAEEELFKKTVKKFSQSPAVWPLFAQFYLTHGRPTEARELLPRSLKSLEKRDHVATISKFAQLEFKLGDAERGRTIFEGIVDSYPKRLDLWLVYVDQEIKQRNTAGVRALFDRILAQRLSSKKGKSVFKKWLAFEKDFGDVAGVEHVKERAVAFVQSRQQADGEDDEE
ncbi:hypothetical protein JCM8097_006594 [Rhodosporidiobolus ruineniae]